METPRVDAEADQFWSLCEIDQEGVFKRGRGAMEVWSCHNWIRTGYKMEGNER